MLESRTWREIVEQPAAWAAAMRSFDVAVPSVARLFQEKSPDEVIFTGCGSSYYLSMTAALAFQRVTGLRSRSIPGSEILQFPESIFPAGSRPLLVASSRSGTTTETLRAVQIARRRGVATLALTCGPRSPLARGVDVCLLSPKGHEESVVMTKSCSSLLLLALLLAANRAEDLALRRDLRRLPALGKRIVKVAVNLTRDLGVDAAGFVFLGAGPAYGIACEAMWKMTELAQQPAAAYHPLEFRHGPVAMIGPGTVVFFFGTRAGARLEMDLATDLRRHGAAVICLRDDWRGAEDMDVDVALGVRLDDEARCLLYLPFAQALAYHRAVGAGLDPDRPRNLTSIVRI